MPQTPLIDRIHAELAAGRAWRAREILRGTVSRTWPDASIIERYGQILADLGDHLEAGKYLFLSGARKPEYTPLIDLFLRRYHRSGAANLVAQFPKSFRRRQFADLPEQLQSELKALGAAPGMFARKERPTPVSAGGRVAGVVAGLVGIFLLACLLVGIGEVFRRILRWIAGLFSG